MDEQIKNTVIVYSCVFGEENKKKYAKGIKRNSLNGDHGSNLTNDTLLMDSRELLGEVCSVNIPDVTFGIYQKNDVLQYDYEIQILIDTCVINKIESSTVRDSEAENEHIEDEIWEDDDMKSVLKPFELDLKQLKELMLPFKRAIYEELDPHDSDIVPSLRNRCLIMPIKLARIWTVVWVKFSKLTKYLEVFQLSGCPLQDDRLCYRSQEFIKSLLLDLFNLSAPNDLMFSYRYIPSNLDFSSSKDTAIVKSIQSILKGYQLNGFNVSPWTLPILDFEEEKANARQTRSLPLMELKDIREFNLKNVKRMPKAVEHVPLPARNLEIRRRSGASSAKIYCNISSQEAGTDGNTKGKTNNKRTRLPAVEEKPKPSVTISKPSSNANSKVVVTLENLANIKKTINYDTTKMLELVEQYVLTYNQVEAFLLDKWSRVNLFSKSEVPEAGLPFLIYGPSQIELEIIREGGIIATNTLKNKIKKYNVTLTTRTMRYLTSSRRWINQRFKLNRKIKGVYYTRDVNLIIPDYRDVPYIVMATHLEYDCLPPEETFEIIHRNWYISRKMVSFIIAECYKCKGKYGS